MEVAMKVSREQAAENRERVVENATRLFKERGYNGIGVAELMRSAGLTHGGFYGNFGSKEALMQEAVDRSFGNTLKAWDKVDESKPAEALESIASSYLSTAHRDNPGYGCLLSALGPEVARMAPEIRAKVTNGVSRQIEKLSHVMVGDAPEERRQAAIVVFASMVGALIMSRAVDDPALSEEFLDAVHDSISAAE
jgi:TetR/AcrR family transcriptional repressor of nem operon